MISQNMRPSPLINGWRRPESIQSLGKDAPLRFPWISPAEHHGTALDSQICPCLVRRNGWREP